MKILRTETKRRSRETVTDRTGAGITLVSAEVCYAVTGKAVAIQGPGYATNC